MLTLTSPVEIWAHRLPAGAKLAALGLATLGLFALSSPGALLAAAALTAGMICTGGWRFAAASLAMLRPLVPFVVIVAVWHLLTRAPAEGAVILLRMVSAVAAANFVTMTTRLADMMATLQRLASPLARLGLNPGALALAVALTVRFIPVMLARLAVIGEAWRARAPRRPGWRILMPATLAALDDAERTAEALRARGGVPPAPKR